ncbi:MAG: hypothetical protein ACI9N1_000181 [Flavobacteriales bacterium]|jgi:hypothetical protein
MFGARKPVYMKVLLWRFKQAMTFHFSLSKTHSAKPFGKLWDRSGQVTKQKTQGLSNNHINLYFYSRKIDTDCYRDQFYRSFEMV